MSNATVVELRENLSDLRGRAQHGHERVTITKNGKPVAAIVSIEDLELRRTIEDRIDLDAAREALREAEATGFVAWDDVRAGDDRWSMPYRIELTPAAARQFRKLPPDQKSRNRRAIDRLAADPRPHGCEKISGADVLWRIRVGDYRIVYEVLDDILVVIVVLSRSEGPLLLSRLTG